MDYHTQKTTAPQICAKNALRLGGCRAIGHGPFGRYVKTGLGTIAGCYVSSGLVAKNASLKLIRDNIVIKDKCVIESLKHFKDDVREAKAGLECGIKIAGFDDVKIGDEFEAYEIVEVARTL